jgi:pimeloyl-ACP methyl ester carboxylesterase
MIRCILAATLFVAGALSSNAQPSLPSSFQARTIHSPADAEIFVRYGGHGPVVVLLHGYAENSDSWAPLAEDLMKDHTVVVPDLRGIGRSSKPAGGYDKKTQAQDIRAVVTALGYDRTFVVAHDIGNMVAYAYAATYPDKVERLVVMDAPIPGIEPWNEILQTQAYGTSTFMDRMQSGWCRDANASTLTGYGTTSLAIQASRTKPQEISSRLPMLSREV